MGTKKRKTKFTALVTYVIVLACMVASLFIPYFGENTSLIQELADALNIVTKGSLDLTASLPEYFAKPFTMTSEYTAFNSALNLSAIAALAYAVVTVLGILALIPIIAGKKRSKMPRVFVYLIEVLAMLSLLLYLFDRATLVGVESFNALRSNNELGYTMLVMIPVIWLFLTIQSIKYKKSSGVIKSLLFLFSGAAVVCLFGENYSVAILNKIGGLANRVGVSSYYIGSTAGFYYIWDVVEIFKNIDAGSLTFWIGALGSCVALLAVLNLVLDTFALATNKNGFGKAVNIIRYALELAGAVAIAVMCYINDKSISSIGIWLAGLLVIALIQLVISVVRACLKTRHEDYDYDYEEEIKEEQAKKAKKAAKKAEKEAAKEAEKAAKEEAKEKEREAKEAEREAEEAAKEAEREAKEEAKAAAHVHHHHEVEKPTHEVVEEVIGGDEHGEEETEEVIEEVPAKDSALAHGFYEAKGSTSTQLPVYTRAYTYQDDGFLNSLTSAERAEFFAIFIDKRNGNYYFMPEYEIGGDNKEFFQMLFIYLGKFMGVISDGLMNKIYRRLNILS